MGNNQSKQETVSEISIPTNQKDFDLDRIHGAEFLRGRLEIEHYIKNQKTRNNKIHPKLVKLLDKELPVLFSSLIFYKIQLARSLSWFKHSEQSFFSQSERAYLDRVMKDHISKKTYLTKRQELQFEFDHNRLMKELEEEQDGHEIWIHIERIRMLYYEHVHLFEQEKNKQQDLEQMLKDPRTAMNAESLQM